MKAHHRPLTFWIASLVCLDSLACLRDLDPSKIECVSDGTCPGGYVCNRATGKDHGTCVSGLPGNDGSVGERPLTSREDGGASERAAFEDGLGDSSVVADASTGAEAADMPTAPQPETGTAGDSRDTSPISGPEVSNADAPMNLPSGAACTSGLQCTNGHCVDGVCCDTQCDGQCESCTESGSGGTCKVRIGAPLPTRTACLGSGMCKAQCDGSARTCVYPGNSTVCTQATCANGSVTLASNCDGAGNCPVQTATPCASNLCRNDGSGKCATSCSAGSCSAGQYCDATGACIPRKTQGSACSSIAECTTGYCVDGVCCDTDCTGQCQVCDTSGTCVRRHSGSPSGGRMACAGAGTTCGGTCDGTSDSCVYPGTSKSCGAATCSSDMSTVNSTTCNGQGACVTPQTNPCGSTTYCSAGSCTNRLTSGSCQTNIQCQSENCSNYSATGTSICCDAGYSNCGSCVNRQTDKSNCGSCGNVCGPNRTCSGGACACTGYSFPSACGGCGSWSFDTGTDNWALLTDPFNSSTAFGTNGATNALWSQTQVHVGSTHSLQIPINVDNVSTMYASVGVPLCPNGSAINVGGFVLSFWIYFAGPAFTAPMSGLIGVVWNSSSDDEHVNFLNDVMPNTWVQMEYTFTSSTPMQYVGLLFTPQWSGTIYLDGVTLAPP